MEKIYNKRSDFSENPLFHALYKNNYMRVRNFILIVCSVFMLCSCYSLQAPIVDGVFPAGTYKYAYISPTKELTSSAGGIYGNRYGTYGATTTKSVNPSDVIAGVLIKNGFAILPEIKADKECETLIVNYGISGRRSVGLGGYTQEVTIQFLSAKTLEKVCSCTAEGIGETEADDISKAITRALNELLKK